MKYELILEMLFIFLIYSFLGWILEVIAVAIKEKKFVNRGVTNGPLCPIYGIGALTILLTTHDQSNIIFVFFGSLIYGTILEFITGKILERVNKNKWWDYSKKKFNLDGYICLQYSILWGVLGVLLVQIINPLFTSIFNSINIYIRSIIVFIALGIVIADLLTSFITLEKIKTDKLENATDKFGNWILNSVKNRIENAYPNFKKKVKEKKQKPKEKSDVFAQGCGFYKLFIIFLIGAFVGDIIEIFFCRYSMGSWMSRSSLVFGQLSLVWGIAIVLACLCLHRYKNKSDAFLFIFGTIVGGAFEYVCSVFTEFFFGTIFWDYSKIPFNLNGRINLLFCFFWGIAAVLIIKVVYPKLSDLIEKIPKKIGLIVTNIILVLFMIDLIITGCVMMRYNTRRQGIEATNIVEKLCDKYADDEFMQNRWKNMKISKKNK